MLLFIISEGLKNLSRTKLAGFVVISVIGVALLIGGWFFVVTMELRDSSGYFSSVTEVEAFLQDEFSADQVEQLMTEIISNPGVVTAYYISKDSAEAIFLQEVGEDVNSLFGENILPPSIRIHLKPDLITPEKIDSVVYSLSGFSGIDEVVVQRDMILTLMRYKKIVWIFHIVIGIAAGTASLILLFNVTRLSIIGKMKSIELMKLVGATNSFIKGQFLIEGIVSGLLGGVLSSILSLGFLSFIESVAGISISLPGNFSIYLIGAGCLLGMLGSNVAVRRYL